MLSAPAHSAFVFCLRDNLNTPLEKPTHHTLSRLLLLALLLTAALGAIAREPVKWNQRYQDYIDRYRDIAVYEMLTNGIPASITMAQGLLESGAGESELCRKGNNHFGIKCHEWTGPTMTRDDDERDECFRVYRSALESYDDHSRFLLRPRYSRLFALRRTDYVGWARGLKTCGYATNPRYAELLIDLIRCYSLDALDRQLTYDATRVRGRKDSPIVPRRFISHITTGAEHSVMMCNRNYYVTARQGDTFRTIAREFGLSYRKLAKYNELDKNATLDDGSRIYLEKKRKRADKQYKRRPHTIAPGESMYTIAQTYGMRLSSLYKKNHLSPDYQPRVGDTLKVY